MERRISLQRSGDDGQPQRADLLPLDRLAGFLLQPVEDGDGILHQPGQVALAPELADEARRMPGAAMGELRLLDEQHILRAQRGPDDRRARCRWRRRR